MMWGKWLKNILVQAVLKHPTAIAWASVQRVLVIRHRFIGDTVLLEPFLRALRHALPSTAVIDVLVSKGSGELLEGHPAVRKLIYVESSRPVAPTLKAQSYDVCFVLKRSWSSVWLAIKAGIPWRIGFDTEGRTALLTHPIPYRLGVHEAESFMDALCVLTPSPLGRGTHNAHPTSCFPHPNLLPKGEGTRSVLTVFIRIDSTKKTLDGFYAFDDGYRDIDVGRHL
jgi:ADP-heptose:LPS heptosyltransferase